MEICSLQEGVAQIHPWRALRRVRSRAPAHLVRTTEYQRQCIASRGFSGRAPLRRHWLLLEPR